MSEMHPERAPVAISGIAWTTALGADLADVWRRLVRGESALRTIPCAYPLRGPLATVLDDPPPLVPPSERLRRLAVDTTARAIADAGLTADDPRLQLIFGTDIGALFDASFATDEALGDWADDAARRLGARRPALSISTACSSGSDVLALGAALVRSAEAVICVCGGVDVLTDVKRLAHSSLGTLSPSTLRAFDACRTGTVFGEGAGVVVLESASSLRARGRRPYAWLRGFGAANDAATLTSPDASGAGVGLAIARALTDGSVARDEVDVLNAHGSGTSLNDPTEARAFGSIWDDGETMPIVFATKGAFGHTLGATGSIEAIVVMMALRTGIIPPVIGFEQADAAVAFRVPRVARELSRARVGASVTLGFGGATTCLIFERAP